MTLQRRTKLIAGIVGFVVLVGGVGFWAFMEASKRAWIRINEYDIRSEGILQVGDPAPDLDLAGVGGETTNLSDLWSTKPLVLTFGSYT